MYPISEIDEVCERENVKNIIVIQHRHGTKATMSLVSNLLSLNLPIYISPDLYQLLTSKVRVSNIVGEPLIDISKTDMSQCMLNMKRVSDIVISFLTLLFISPLLLAVAIAVRCSSKGPVFINKDASVIINDHLIFINSVQCMWMQKSQDRHCQH